MMRMTLLGMLLLTFASSASNGAAKVTTTTLTQKDNGSTVAIEIGGIVNVTLPGNITTGYSWAVDRIDASIIKPVGDHYIPSQTGQVRVGSGGEFTFDFKALKAGDTKIRLIYARPWEKAAPQAGDVFEAALTIREVKAKPAPSK